MKLIFHGTTALIMYMYMKWLGNMLFTRADVPTSLGLLLARVAKTNPRSSLLPVFPVVIHLNKSYPTMM